jgi:protoporphyrinogen oxidase
MRIAIIGGGLTGLTAAYELGKAGHAVDIFEAEEELGGQARTFPVAGTRLEVFYHHLFLSDRDILDLAAELGVNERIAWLPSKAGFLYQGTIYPFSTPQDLLRFRPLHLFNRVRLGLVSLFLMRYENWRALERFTAERWIRRWAGRQAYEVMWRALLAGKFGEAAGEVSMTWFWGKIHLRGGSRQGLGEERLGYPEGSFQVLLDALTRAIEAQGGRLHTGARVRMIQLDEWRVRSLYVREDWRPGPYDVIVATVPSTVFRQIAPFLSREYGNLLRAARYQGALCLVLQLKRALSDIYWLNISDPQSPFVGAIEHTNFVSPEVYGGRHLVYLTNYLQSEHSYFSLSKEELLQTYLPGLRQINPAFDLDWVEDTWRFADAAAQPIVLPFYGESIPPHRTSVPNLFLANTTQIYPEDRGTNYSVRLGRKVARLVGETPLTKKAQRHQQGLE